MPDNRVKNDHPPEFELWGIIRDVSRQWALIVLLPMLVALITYIAATARFSPAFTADATCIVSASDSEMAGTSDMTGMMNLARTFASVLNSSVMRNKVAETLDLPELDGTIDVQAIPETNLLAIKVTASSPGLAFRITQALIENYSAITGTFNQNANLEVLQAPVVPTVQNNSQERLNLAARAALLAVFIVIAALAVLSGLKDTAKSAKTLLQKTDINLIESVCHERAPLKWDSRFTPAQSELLITDPATSQRFIETFKKIRTKIDLQAEKKPCRTLLVTSALDDEGKSTVAANIALALAQKYARVLLIDADLRNPGLCRLFGLDVENGADTQAVLARKAVFCDSMLQSGGYNLRLLLQPGRAKSSLELISSPALRELLDQERNRWDYIILDSPPMAISADTEMLAECVDASLLVVRRNCAKIQEINEAADTLKNGHSDFLGCIFNDAATPGRLESRMRRSSQIPRTGGQGLGFIAADALRGAKKLYWVAIAMTAVLTLVFGIGMKLSYSPEYQSSSTFVININRGAGSLNGYYNIITTDQVGKTLPNILQSEALAKIVASQLGMEELPGTILTTVESNTNLITLTVTAADPELAESILLLLIRNYSQVAGPVIGETSLTVIEQTGMAAEPANPFSFFNALLMGLYGGLAIFALAVALHVANHSTILRAQDIRRLLDIWCISAVPKVQLKRGGRDAQTPLLITNPEIPGSFAEAFSLLRARILKIRDTHVLLVTSALANEGKTTIAVNLALSLAQKGCRAALVDCEMRNPSILRFLGKEPAPFGLAEYLKGEAKLNQIKMTLAEFNNLVVIPGGKPCDDASEIIGSMAMRGLIAKLKRTADYVILDSAPLDLYTDTAILSRFADQVIFVVKQDFAGRDQIAAGLESLNERRVPVLGCVLNNARNSFAYTEADDVPENGILAEPATLKLDVNA